MGVADDIRQKAFELGLDLVGITDASAIDAEQIALLTDWLKRRYAGQMSYMLRNFAKRIEPARLLEGAQSVICVGLNYKPPTGATRSAEPAGRIANYAWYEDYHVFIKNRLRKLAYHVRSLVGRNFEFKICVDSAPVAERSLAARAGLGFIGKNHMLINPDLGPQIFLGEVITELRLETNEPIAGRCRGCDKCMKACPTGALRDDGQFDASRCISYLTIEHKDEIPADLTGKLGYRLFGCDECVLACPYQQKGPVCKNGQFKFHNDRARLDLSEILSLSAESFEAKFANSPIKRLGLERLKRNARVVLKNMATGSTEGSD
jgi:epoxyqueuosine reductase